MSSSLDALHHHKPIRLSEWTRTAVHITQPSISKVPLGMAGTEMLDERTIDEQMKHASTIFQQGDYTKADKEYEAVTKANPDLAEAWYQLGLCEELTGHPQHALPVFEKAASLKKNDKDARLHLASNLMELQQPKEAFIQYKEAVRLDTNFADAWLGLAQASHATGNDSLAVDLAHQAQSKNPAFVPAFIFIGQLLIQQKKNDEAEKAFDAIIQKFPESHQAAEHFANFFYVTGKYTEGERLYKRALELDPKCVTSTAGVAGCLAGEKRFADAEKQFQKAISMNPNDPNLHVELGKVYSALEKSDLEIAEYKEAIQLNPNFADAHLSLGLTAFQKFHNTTLALDEYAILKELDKEKAHELFAVIYK